MPDWEQLREAKRATKERVLRHLDTYSLQLEESVQREGGHVHWACDGQEANAIIIHLAQHHQAREVIKVKSSTTDEIHLNEALQAVGITAYETDLPGAILQLFHDTPSHIVVPSLHKNRAEIYAIFKQAMHSINVHLSDDPRVLIEA